MVKKAVLSFVLFCAAFGVSAADTAGFFRELNAIGPHPPGSRAHAEARDYIYRTLKGFGAETEIEEFYYENDYEGYIKGYNIIARFGSQGSPAAGFATHWDTRPVADRDPDPARRDMPIAGANDGNSSTAVLLALAKRLSVTGVGGGYGAILYFFDAEDSGKTSSGFCRGSDHHVRYGLEKDLAFGVLIDMIGDRDLSIPMERFSYSHARVLCENIWRYAREEKGYYFFRDRTGPAITDDHLPFLAAGIPFVDIIDLDYDHWHTTEDTADKCSTENMDKILELLTDIAEDPERFMGR